MRIDSDAEAGRFELDPRARLRHFFGVFKRQWYLVLVPALVGTALGWFSAPGPPPKPKSGTPTTVAKARYYEATHVLIQESAAGSGSNSGGSRSVNLPQAAYLVNTGEVPQKVAQQLGLPVQDVESRLIGLPRDQVASIEVKAVGPDAAQVVAMSNAAATELMSLLKVQAVAAANAQRDGIVTQLDSLDRQLKSLNFQIAMNPPDRTQLEAQQRSLSNQYSLVFQQFTDLANAPTPSAGLVSLQDARPQPISESDYRETLRMIREGASYVTGSQAPPTTQPPEADSTGEPGEPVGRGTRGALGGLVGLAVGVGLVLLLDRFDGRLRRREDVEASSGLTVISEIPRLGRKAQRSSEVVVETSPRSRASEAYRVVRSAAIYTLGKMTPKSYTNGTANPAAVIMVTSASAGEGKTTTVANLAAVFAEGGLDVLVVNCDFRRPRIQRYLLEHPEDVTAEFDVMVPRRTRIERVDLVTGIGEGEAEAHPLEVVALQQQVIDAQRGNYHLILLDTAPFLTTNDASELLPRTDLVTLVVRSGRTTRDSVHRSAEVLEWFSASVLGVVLNVADESRGAQYYYYGYAEPSSKAAESEPQAAARQRSSVPTT